ncbi:uncharacterized protein PAC_10566 [Phialocephala subalpina]|uniref:Uncharacterized protein n=1 Tax=Phialocephala subalpina TaxID=576137 RepID=A0A1L7X6L8_9HELO|nr:uncharacterized protein PAC_10566 [Phialocephala subalpina]
MPKRKIASLGDSKEPSIVAEASTRISELAWGALPLSVIVGDTIIEHLRSVGAILKNKEAKKGEITCGRRSNALAADAVKASPPTIAAERVEADGKKLESWREDSAEYLFRKSMRVDSGHRGYFANLKAAEDFDTSRGFSIFDVVKTEQSFHQCPGDHPLNSLETDALMPKATTTSTLSTLSTLLKPLPVCSSSRTSPFISRHATFMCNMQPLKKSMHVNHLAPSGQKFIRSSPLSPASSTGQHMQEKQPHRIEGALTPADLTLIDLGETEKPRRASQGSTSPKATESGESSPRLQMPCADFEVLRHISPEGPNSYLISRSPSFGAPSTFGFNTEQQQILDF